MMPQGVDVLSRGLILPQGEGNQEALKVVSAVIRSAWRKQNELRCNVQAYAVEALRQSVYLRGC